MRRWRSSDASWTTSSTSPARAPRRARPPSPSTCGSTRSWPLASRRHGAGPGSGAARKDTVDRAAAALLADAGGLGGVEGQAPTGTDDVFGAYLRAKKAAEDDLRARELDWTVLRPGRLTDGAGTGRVTLDYRVPSGSVARADVAAVLLALLHRPYTAGLTAELIEGTVPVVTAIDALAEDPH